jgi:hypothetical protein
MLFAPDGIMGAELRVMVSKLIPETLKKENIKSQKTNFK